MARLRSAIGLVAVGGALLLGGCQLIAGVRNDAVPAEPDGGTDGGDGGEPCESPSDCPGGVCFNGLCCRSSAAWEELCKDRCGVVTDECGRPFECGDCVAPATCGENNTCE